MDQNDIKIAELVRRSGLSRSSVNAVLKAKYKSASLSTVERLAVVFGVSVDQLLGVRLDAAPIHPLIKQFMESEWRASVNPEEQELEWVKSLPDVVFTGARPDPQVVARLILWRRDTSAAAPTTGSR
jgi:transcriptional regulator with XRE-family HTH domain